MLLQNIVGEGIQNTQDVYGGGGMKKDESGIWECNLSTGKIQIITKPYIRL